MNAGVALFAILAFIAVVLLLEGFFVYWNDSKSPEVRRVEQRLRAISAGGHEAGESQLLKQRVMSNSPALQPDHPPLVDAYAELQTRPGADQDAPTQVDSRADDQPFPLYGRVRVAWKEEQPRTSSSPAGGPVTWKEITEEMDSANEELERLRGTMTDTRRAGLRERPACGWLHTASA